jgi:hypothetical protein
MTDDVKNALEKISSYNVAYGLAKLAIDYLSETNIPTDDPIVEHFQNVIESIEKRNETILKELDTILKTNYGQQKNNQCQKQT